MQIVKVYRIYQMLNSKSRSDCGEIYILEINSNVAIVIRWQENRSPSVKVPEDGQFCSTAHQPKAICNNICRTESNSFRVIFKSVHQNAWLAYNVKINWILINGVTLFSFCCTNNEINKRLSYLETANKANVYKQYKLMYFIYN